MSPILQVQSFLNAFKTKLAIWGIIFASDRQKNTQTLAALEILPSAVKDILAELTETDYSDGPISDVIFQGAEMWIFGKLVKGHEIYIKITLGFHNRSAVCISFHFAEHPMPYPFKT